MTPNPDADTHVAFPELPHANGSKPAKSTLRYQVKWKVGDSLWTKEFDAEIFFPEIDHGVLTIKMQVQSVSKIMNALSLSPATLWTCDLISSKAK
jgi:hypothetical protein